MGEGVIEDVGTTPVPWVVNRMAGLLPLAAVDWPLDHAVRSFVRRNPSILARLGSHATAAYLIDPTDLPFAFLLQLNATRPRIRAVRKPCGVGWDARIAGALGVLLGLVHGTFDGDALFFSRDLTIEGDTAAVLALRNAIDDAEIDIATEIAAAMGPAAPMAAQIARRALPRVSRLTGLPLTRAGEQN